MALYHSMRNQRWLIAKITGGFLILGLLIALFSTPVYTSDALLLPDTESSGSSAGNLLQNYTGMLGLGNLGSLNMSDEGGIPPMVYPRIVTKPFFQNNLLEKEYYFSNMDTTVTGYTYFEELHRPSLIGLILGYTIGLPGKLAAEDTTVSPTLQWARQHFDADSVVALSGEELGAIQQMQQRITIELDSQTGVLNITAQMPDPAAAAQVNRTAINMLKTFVKSYSTQKAQENLEYAQLQHEQARERFETAQNQLAEFQDQNINPSTATARTEERRLQTEFDLATSMYNNVSQQLMAARMKVQEQTPVFKPLQEVNVPTSASGPNRPFILIVSIILGLVVSFIYIAGKDIYYSLRTEFN